MSVMCTLPHGNICAQASPHLSPHGGTFCGSDSVADAAAPIFAAAADDDDVARRPIPIHPTRRFLIIVAAAFASVVLRRFFFYIPSIAPFFFSFLAKRHRRRVILYERLCEGAERMRSRGSTRFRKRILPCSPQILHKIRSQPRHLSRRNAVISRLYSTSNSQHLFIKAVERTVYAFSLFLPP